MSNLRAVLRIELIADDFFYQQKRGMFDEEFDKWLRYAKRLGPDKRPSWAARINGITDRGTFTRTFCEGYRDYTQANATGSRGIFVYYPLGDGVYEVHARVTMSEVDHYFLRVESGEMTRISRQEVIAWLEKSD